MLTERSTSTPLQRPAKSGGAGIHICRRSRYTHAGGVTFFFCFRLPFFLVILHTPQEQVYLYACMYVYIRLYVYTCMYVRVQVYTCGVWRHTYICMYAYVYTYIHAYVCRYIRVACGATPTYACMHTYVRIYMHTYAGIYVLRVAPHLHMHVC
jgi:hypothetical protein